MRESTDIGSNLGEREMKWGEKRRRGKQGGEKGERGEGGRGEGKEEMKVGVLSVSLTKLKPICRFNWYEHIYTLTIQ